MKQGRGNEWMRRGIFLDVPGVIAAIQSTKKKHLCETDFSASRTPANDGVIQSFSFDSSQKQKWRAELSLRENLM